MDSWFCNGNDRERQTHSREWQQRNFGKYNKIQQPTGNIQWGSNCINMHSQLHIKENTLLCHVIGIWNFLYHSFPLLIGPRVAIFNTFIYCPLQITISFCISNLADFSTLNKVSPISSVFGLNICTHKALPFKMMLLGVVAFWKY